MSLQKKLDGDSLLPSAAAEIRALHGVFVAWFQGHQSIEALSENLRQRMHPQFTHVAPNGHMVCGRDVLLTYLKDKYAFYKDRVFHIDVHNVKLVWASDLACLLSYEEWQSWKDEGQHQQFGRLSTALLERSAGNKFQWMHVHETWMEAEAPILEEASEGEEETIVTGPVHPNPSGGYQQPSQSASNDSPVYTDAAAPMEENSNGASESSSEYVREAADQITEIKISEPPMTKEEEQFLQASQGILFFEDEDKSPLKPPAETSKSTQSDDFDELMQLDVSENSEHSSSQAMLSLHSAANASHKRHVTSKLSQYATPLQFDGSLVGISIKGFDIGTSQGPIADSAWFNNTTTKMEAKAQPPGTTARKLALPEMCFPSAHVAVEGCGVWMSWDATDALAEWALQHAQIPVGSSTVSGGVSVLKVADAAKWKEKRVSNNGKTSFHYDWTYCTPFTVKCEGGSWIELDESGMRMDLLTDQSVPILFFDEIVLFEDDLHDNGVSQYSIKLRIMPTCAYILARLWVRVDNVLIRLRETRVLVDFFGLKPQIYRDVSWRECDWDDLPMYDLPIDVVSWTVSEDSVEWSTLTQKLPAVPLAEGILAHAVLEHGSEAITL